jgi:hypothetical protein
MQWVKPKVKAWGRPNLIHNVKEKTSKSKQKHGMTRQANSQVPTLGPTQDLKHVPCKSKNMSKMMLEKKWLCNLSKMVL